MLEVYFLKGFLLKAYRIKLTNLVFLERMKWGVFLNRERWREHDTGGNTYRDSILGKLV